MENEREMMGQIERHETLYLKRNPETAEMMRLYSSALTVSVYQTKIQLLPRILQVNDL